MGGGSRTRARSQGAPQTPARGEGCPAVSQNTSVTISLCTFWGEQELRGTRSPHCKRVRRTPGLQAPRAPNVAQVSVSPALSSESAAPKDGGLPGAAAGLTWVLVGARAAVTELRTGRVNNTPAFSQTQRPTESEITVPAGPCPTEDLGGRAPPASSSTEGSGRPRAGGHIAKNHCPPSSHGLRSVLSPLSPLGTPATGFRASNPGPPYLEIPNYTCKDPCPQ